MNLSTLARISPVLNPTRLRYPYFIGAALWLGWFLSLALGSGNLDAAGHLIGTDFAAFYTAGKIILMGQSADLYNLDLAHQIQQPLYQRPSENFNPYLNPPFYALIFVSFAWLPYPWSPILWMAFNVVLLFICLKLFELDKPWKTFFLTLTWQPAFAAISFGQNAFLSLTFLSLSYFFWRKGRLWTAGLLAGLLFYKPQLLIGIGLLCLLDLRRHWRVLAGCSITIACLSGLSLWLLPEATMQYILYTQKIAANLMTVDGFPIWNAHAVQAFWLALIPEQTVLAQALHWICALLGGWLFYKFWRAKQNDLAGLFGAALCLTVWITPYIMIYDWVLLLIPAILLWDKYPNQHENLKVIYAFLWLAMFISSALTFVQWTYFGRALQISIPALAIMLLTLLNITKSLENREIIASAG